MQNGLKAFAFLGLLTGANAFSEPQIKPLSEMRTKLVLPKYTAEEKIALSSQAEFMLRNLYVHRHLKIKDFGTDADPLPRLERLKLKAGQIENDEFHSSMQKVFTSLHDLHTSYAGPKPLACGVAFIPIRFDVVKEGNDFQVVAARRAAVAEELVSDIALGDRLISVDGKPASDVLASLMPVSGGSNIDAMRSRSVQLLSMRNLASQTIPAKDTLKLELTGENGIYEKEIPWMTLSEETCFGENLPAPQNDFFFLSKLGIDQYQHRFNYLFDTKSSSNALDGDSADLLSEIFEANTLKTPAGVIGYIRLKTFIWRNRRLDLSTIVEGLRRTVEVSFSKAVGLVIDVRGNGGGHIVLAEKMVQLFSPRIVEPTTVRMLANELNEKIFLKANGGENRWSEAIRDALGRGDEFTAPLAITPRREANSLGQVWFRPVVVLTDSSCYSACDLFAAGMQDNGAAVIVGTHSTTGGGGANVMEYKTFQAILGDNPENPFSLLPQGQSMRVSWRQSIRSGKNNGSLIEDKGVESNIVVPLSKDDIGFESRELMRQIHRIIDKLQPKYTSGLNPKVAGLVLLKNHEAAKWIEKMYGIDSVEVQLGDKSLGEWPVPFSVETADVEINVESLTGDWTDSRVVIIGKNKNSGVFRVVRDLMWRGDYIGVPEAGLKVEPKGTDLGLLHSVILKGAKDSGWREVEGALRVGAGPLYGNDILVRAFLPVKLDKKIARVSLDLGVKAEDVNDSLRIYALNPDTGDRMNYFAGSRRSFKAGVKFPLPESWDRADLVFEFESDENWNLEGPVIKNLTVTPVNENPFFIRPRK